MALVIKDRVKEVTTTTGTGTLTLGGTFTGYQAFSVIGNGNTTYYTIIDSATGAWEVGIGTYTASGTTLSRDTVLDSSASGAKVSFGAGSKEVWGDYPAGKAVTTDTLAYPPAIGGTTPAAGSFTTLISTTNISGTTWNQGTGVLQVVGNAGVSGNTVTGQLYNAGGNNLFTYSEQFNNAAWIKSDASVTDNIVEAPNGTLTADKLIEAATNSSHLIYRIGLVAGSYTISFYAKAAERNTLQIEQESGGNSRFVLTGSGTATALGANRVSITALSNGWYRCTTTFTATGNWGAYFIIYNGATVYSGDGTSGVYIWGAQLEVGQVASTYTPTTSAAVTTSNRIFAGSGTAALPGLAFNADGATGMWQPAASTLAWSTGGSERVRLTSGLSIGTTTDAGSTNLLVAGTATSPAFITSSGNIITDSSTSRTLSAGDNGKTIYFTSSSAITLNTATSLGAGFSCVIIQAGTGTITVTAASSTTVNSYGALVKTAGQYAMANIMAPVADTFYLSGQLA